MDTAYVRFNATVDVVSNGNGDWDFSVGTITTDMQGMDREHQVCGLTFLLLYFSEVIHATLHV